MLVHYTLEVTGDGMETYKEENRAMETGLLTHDSRTLITLYPTIPPKITVSLELQVPIVDSHSQELYSKWSSEAQKLVDNEKFSDCTLMVSG
jgi:hypothetical protein